MKFYSFLQEDYKLDFLKSCLSKWKNYKKMAFLNGGKCVINYNDGRSYILHMNVIQDNINTLKKQILHYVP